MESSRHALVNFELADKSRTPSFLDAQNERTDLEQDSTRAPSTAPDAVNGKEEETLENYGKAIDDDEKGNVPLGEADPDSEYPTGARLGFIVFALIMSIFLIALDMVNTIPNSMFSV